MSIVNYQGGPITHRYLMNNSKAELARMVLRLLQPTDLGSDPDVIVRSAPRCMWTPLRYGYSTSCGCVAGPNSGIYCQHCGKRRTEKER